MAKKESIKKAYKVVELYKPAPLIAGSMIVPLLVTTPMETTPTSA